MLHRFTTPIPSSPCLHLQLRPPHCGIRVHRAHLRSNASLCLFQFAKHSEGMTDWSPFGFKMEPQDIMAPPQPQAAVVLEPDATAIHCCVNFLKSKNACVGTVPKPAPMAIDPHETLIAIGAMQRASQPNFLVDPLWFQHASCTLCGGPLGDTVTCRTDGRNFTNERL